MLNQIFLPFFDNEKRGRIDINCIGFFLLIKKNHQRILMVLDIVDIILKGTRKDSSTSGV